MAASHEEESYRFPNGSSLTTPISPRIKDRKIKTLGTDVIRSQLNRALQ